MCTNHKITKSQNHNFEIMLELKARQIDVLNSKNLLCKVVLLLKVSGTNQRPEQPWPSGTGLVRHCPHGLFSPLFTFLHAIFFCPFRLSLAPNICPWVSRGWIRAERLELVEILAENHLDLVETLNHLTTTSPLMIQLILPVMEQYRQLKNILSMLDNLDALKEKLIGRVIYWLQEIQTKRLN